MLFLSLKRFRFIFAFGLRDRARVKVLYLVCEQKTVFSLKNSLARDLYFRRCSVRKQGMILWSGAVKSFTVIAKMPESVPDASGPAAKRRRCRGGLCSSFKRILCG